MNCYFPNLRPIVSVDNELHIWKMFDDLQNEMLITATPEIKVKKSSRWNISYDS